MCADEAVVQFPSSTLSLSHPMAGLWVLLCSSQLFRPLSHPHMQGTNHYTCVFLICRYTDGGFHSYKKLYLCFIGLCFGCIGGSDDKDVGKVRERFQGVGMSDGSSSTAGSCCSPSCSQFLSIVFGSRSCLEAREDGCELC
jgi:hypothetical protein